MFEYSTIDFVAGLITMGFLVAGLFFLRFWRRTHDSLFLIFAGAFWLFALNQGLVVLVGTAREEHSWIYLLRIAGFTLLIAAIVHKNLGARRRL
jgi:Family of unknown function (DUF5985)